MDYPTNENIYVEEVKNAIFIYQVREAEYNLIIFSALAIIKIAQKQYKIHTEAVKNQTF